MALERRDASQVVTWLPPLPQRAYKILQAGSTTELPPGYAIGPDGTRFGWYTVDTTQWAVVEGMHVPPVAPGEKFQLWTAGTGYSSFINPSMFENGNVAAGAAIPGNTANSAPDLFNVFTLTLQREAAGGSPAYVLKDPQVCTVIAVQQATSGSWNVYFSPQLSTNEMPVPGKDGIITIPSLSQPRWLGRVGHVSGLDYTYSLPGGPDQLTCTLQIEPNYRTDAMNPGRIVTVHRGASCVWEGQLTEPTPASTGWTINANGCGTYGTNFGAWYQSGIGTNKGTAGWTTDSPVDLAIARGMRWANAGIGNHPGIYLGPVQNPGSLTITDFMNLLCTGGGLTWELVPPPSAASFPPGPWEIKVSSLPQDFSGNPLQAGPSQKVTTTKRVGSKWVRTDRLEVEPRVPAQLTIVNVNPVARSIVADINTVIVYYQATPDITATAKTPAKAATYSTTFADIPSSVAMHGRMEYYVDISNGGVYTRNAAAQVAANILNKYIRVNFSNPFSVQPGQLLNDGGVPVDLGCNWGGYTCEVVGIDYAMGGEVGLAPIQFVIGQYEYSDESQTATITPYQSAATDMASVISMLYPGKFS